MDSLSFCMRLYFVRFSMSRRLTSVLYESLCCPSFYVTWPHFYSVWVYMLSEFLCHLVSFQFCMGLYVVRVSMSLGLTFILYGFTMLSNFLFHLASLSFFMGIYLVRVSVSLGLTSVLYVSICCPSFYVTWSHFRVVCTSMLSEFICHLVSFQFCMGLYVFRFSMSLGLTSVLYVSLCYLGFYSGFILPLCSWVCYILRQIIPFAAKIHFELGVTLSS